mmetsp:Transcript_15248/g.46045  ORF Transcript_15248/g.46045 Transcript_15248/m.46045 type:complete len:215 (+) Transcript_15248:6581-7225(+)
MAAGCCMRKAAPSCCPRGGTAAMARRTCSTRRRTPCLSSPLRATWPAAAPAGPCPASATSPPARRPAPWTCCSSPAGTLPTSQQPVRHAAAARVALTAGSRWREAARWRLSRSTPRCSPPCACGCSTQPCRAQTCSCACTRRGGVSPPPACSSTRQRQPPRGPRAVMPGRRTAGREGTRLPGTRRAPPTPSTAPAGSSRSWPLAVQVPPRRCHA